MIKKQYVISPENYKFISNILYNYSGICIEKNTKKFINSRIFQLVFENKMLSLSEYCDYLKSNEEAIKSLIDALITNYSYFFREKNHFDFLNKQLAFLAKYDLLRIWCAGCATADEAYSLSILFSESANKYLINYKIDCTDISNKVLIKAQEGIFSDFHLKEVKKDILEKYFTYKDHEFHINPKLKEHLIFRCDNLIRPEIIYKNTFHIIFCRNVMIYFDSETMKKLVQYFYDALQPGGYLFLGSSEMLRHLDTPFKYIEPTIYQKPLT